MTVFHELYKFCKKGNYFLLILHSALGPYKLLVTVVLRFLYTAFGVCPELESDWLSCRCGVGDELARKSHGSSSTAVCLMSFCWYYYSRSFSYPLLLFSRYVTVEWRVRLRLRDIENSMYLFQYFLQQKKKHIRLNIFLDKLRNRFTVVGSTLA